MKKSQVSPNVKRAVETLQSAPKAKGRILSAKEIMDRSLALSEIAERAEGRTQPTKSGLRSAPRSLHVHQPELVAV